MTKQLNPLVQELRTRFGELTAQLDQYKSKLNKALRIIRKLKKRLNQYRKDKECSLLE